MWALCTRIIFLGYNPKSYKISKCLIKFYYLLLSHRSMIYSCFICTIEFVWIILQTRNFSWINWKLKTDDRIEPLVGACFCKIKRFNYTLVVHSYRTLFNFANICSLNWMPVVSLNRKLYDELLLEFSLCRIRVLWLKNQTIIISNSNTARLNGIWFEK